MTDERSNSTPSQTRYAYMRNDGTAYIVAGSAIAGLSAYAYQLLGGRVLGAEAFAPVSVLLTIHFLTFIVVLIPIEQLIVRRITIDRSWDRLPPQAYWLTAMVIVGATIFVWFGAEKYLNGDYRFVAFVALTIVVHFIFANARGHLAGWRRFKAYGVSSGAASVVRLAIATGIVFVHPSASGFAVALILAPLVVLLWRPFHPRELDRAALDEEAKTTLGERGLLTGLVLAAAASQALLLSGPLIVGLLGGTAVEISIAFAAFTLGRAPLVFGYNLLARVLPPFTEMAARGERDELRSWARGMGWAAVAIALIAGVLGWFLGPWVVSVAFGSEFTPDRIDALAISVGVVFAGAGLFVGQILVARGESVRLAIAWFGALAASVATIILASTAGPITRVGLGFAAGAAFALLALVWGAVLTRKADRTERGSLAGYLLTKRTLDIAVALTLLILTTPVLVLAGIAVRIDSKGPIFFRQMRIGRDAKAFGLLKIRTMQADADEAVFAEHLERLEAARHSETGPPIRIDDDDRVTRIGAVLRRWSIDELPNFWNVLKGSMSLVGPRPLVPAEAELVGLNSSRFQVKPGITGLAQVHGRDAITMAERTRLDEEYVESRSGRLDLKILTLTAKTVFTEPGD